MRLSRTNYESLYGALGANFPDNTTGLITELIMRSFGKDTSDSFLNNVNDIQLLTTATGTDAYVVTGSITTYSPGFIIFVMFTNGNTGASTINVNGLGVVDLKKMGSTALISGDIADGEIKILIFDGVNFQIFGGGGISIDTTWDMSTNAFPTGGNQGQEYYGTELSTRTTLTDSAGNLLPSKVIAKALISNPLVNTDFAFINVIF